MIIKCAHFHENVRVGVDAPLTQSFFAYLLLNLVYVPIVLHRRQKLQVSMAASESTLETVGLLQLIALTVLSTLVLQIAWYWYLALAFIDVQGNYLGEYRHHTDTLSPRKFFLLQLITV